MENKGPDLGAIWDEMPVKPGFKEIGPLIALAAAFFFLLEIFERRTGFFENFILQRKALSPERKKSKTKNKGSSGSCAREKREKG